MGTAKYSTVVKAVGGKISEIPEGMTILFGDNAPQELKDYCCTIEVKPLAGDILPGQQFVIDGITHRIMAVGDVAGYNLSSLGHLTIISGDEMTVLPGAIRVEGEVGRLKVGSIIRIMG